MPTLEEIVSTRDLQKHTKVWLDKAESGPVSVQRPGGNAITMVSRTSWADAARAQEWLAHSASIMAYIILRARNLQAEPPSNFAWLKIYSIDDLRDFTEELAGALQAACSGVRPFTDVEGIVKEWHHSAIVLMDEELVGRLDDVKKKLKK